LERIGAAMEQSSEGAGMMQRGPRMALEKVRRKGLCRPPPVRINGFVSSFTE